MSLAVQEDDGLSRALARGGTVAHCVYDVNRHNLPIGVQTIECHEATYIYMYKDTRDKHMEYSVVT
jgi:hypothetical protein